MEVFDFFDYKQFLNKRLDDRRAGGGRGMRAKLSKSIGCQTAYTAQVLRGSSHFSLEQAEAINEFLGHTDDESLYFITLVQFNRAGSVRLRDRMKRQLEGIRESRLLLKKRLGVKQVLTQADQTIYYSHWYYAAIHALVSIPGYRNTDKISAALKISRSCATSAVNFLLSCGLLITEGGQLKIGTARLHLGTDSPLLVKHHINWRVRAIESLDSGRAEDLHYSSAISISKADALKIREQLVKTIEQIKPVIRDSSEEEAHSFCIDLFKITD